MNAVVALAIPAGRLSQHSPRSLHAAAIDAKDVAGASNRGVPQDGVTLQRPWQIQAYLGLSRIAGPFYKLLLRKRLRQGKEVASRLGERFGQTQQRRPDGQLIWFHAASVGESQALLTPIRQFLAQEPGLHVLVTTTTRTSAEILAQQLPDRAFHQFSPVDTTQATRAFLDHWQPDLAIWTESEIWPCLMVETAKRGIGMHLINARVSPKTVERWRKNAKILCYLLGKFDSVATQDAATRDLIIGLGVEADRVMVTGSTKSQAAPLPHDPEELSTLRAAIGARKCWLAASTHAGEEEQVLSAHQRFLQNEPDALLILAPRHPERGAEAANHIAASQLTSARRSLAEPLNDGTQVYLADTVGEMGLWYRLAPISFVGGSLLPIGGHNPYEPIILGSAVISGTEVHNFQAAYAALSANSGVRLISDADDLYDTLRALQDPDVKQAQQEAATEVIAAPNQALDHLFAVLKAVCLLNENPLRRQE